MMQRHCPICESDSPKKIGGRKNKYRPTTLFDFYQCQHCWFAFVGNPRTDYENIYNSDYYMGNGVDTYVNYLHELQYPDTTIRNYEWQALARIVKGLLSEMPIVTTKHWLDYGCGNGGLVRYANNHNIADCVGFEEGWIAQEAHKQHIPLINKSDFEAMRGHFDVITAIEVIEHVVDPLTFLQEIRSLLKPGGYFFLTTGNASRFRGKIHQWGYSMAPEVHVSFFEPETLAFALKKAGFEPVYRKYPPGFNRIIQYKILKGLYVKNRHTVFNFIPWSLIGAAFDHYYGISHIPLGRAI